MGNTPLGIDPSAFTGSQEEFFDAVHPDDREKLKKALIHTMVHGAPYNPDYRVIWPDGSTHHITARGRLGRDDLGRPLRINGIIWDITDRTQAEEALKESEERYRIAIEGALDGVTIIQNDVHSYVNRSFLNMFGYITDEIVGKYRYCTVHPDDRERVTHYARARQNGEYVPTRYEFKGIRKDGTPIDIEVSANTILYKGEKAILAYLRDITERKRMGEALRESETLQRILLANLPAGVIIIDPVTRMIESVNSAAAAMFGVQGEQIVGHRCHAFLCPASRDACPVCDLGQEVDNSEREMICADGSRRPVLKSVKRVEIRGQQKLLECFIDISDRKQAEKERSKLESQLRQSQKLEAVGTLTGGIAHDFNNILTVITGFGTLLQMNMEEESPLRIYVDQILSGAEKAAQLTQTLLAFSRKRLITLKPVNINEIVSGSEKLLNRLLTEDIVVHTLLAPDEIVVMADATQVEQILFNLATNARDAMPKGGVLTIATKSVELDEEFKVIHGYGEPGRYARLSISDTGMGMDEATKEKIFDPFFTTKEVGKGTGLGLSSVYGTVKQHDGYITVYSEPDTGTIFHIYLPVVNRGAEEEEPAPAPPERGDETVLVAEDNEALRGLFRDVLIAYGYRVIEATDGADAIEQFKKADKVDLLILDSVMPKKNGREAYNEMHEIGPSTKVLFISGYTRDVVLNKGIEDGRFDFLSKPISPSALLQKVREVLDN